MSGSSVCVAPTFFWLFLKGEQMGIRVCKNQKRIAIVLICFWSLGYGLSFGADESSQQKTSNQADLKIEKQSEIQKSQKKSRKSKGLLSDQQINLIKLYELDTANKPVVKITRADFEQFLEDYQNEKKMPKTKRGKRSLHRWKNYQKLQLMFDLKAREYYPKVIVKTIPLDIKRFNKNVYYSYILSYCATSGCHTQKTEHGFKIIAKNTKSTPVLFTNYYQLKTYRLSGYEMIDQDKPELSLLLQYGLPRASAKNPHPKVKRWRPRFRTKKNKLYQQVYRWIHSLPTEKIAYPFEFNSKPIAPNKKPSDPKTTPNQSNKRDRNSDAPKRNDVSKRRKRDASE